MVLIARIERKKKEKEKEREKVRTEKHRFQLWPPLQ